MRIHRRRRDRWHIVGFRRIVFGLFLNGRAFLRVIIWFSSDPLLHEAGLMV